ncbi:MAG: prolipoprotein diacylglyceryl transferase [Gammaproteobacteria bacterium]
MLTYPSIDPVAVQIGPIKIHWYGLMYLVGFGLGWWLGRLRAKDPARRWRLVEFDDLVVYVALGAVIGGRLGYAIFYDLTNVLREPLSILQVWQGGMSFHGGLIGVIIAMWMYARRHKRPFFEVADFVAPLVPPGLGAGRIGNFINGELWGKPTDLPWGIVFPSPQAEGLARHPSQLYQAFLEGLVLFMLLWIFSRKPRPTMAVSGLFLVGYGTARFLVEFVRVPDPHIGYLAFGWFTMGQLLTLPMLVFGALLFWLAYRKGSLAPSAVSSARPGALPVAHGTRSKRLERAGEGPAPRSRHRRGNSK